MPLVVAAITFKFYRKFYFKFYCACDRSIRVVPDLTISYLSGVGVGENLFSDHRTILLILTRETASVAVLSLQNCKGCNAPKL